MDLSDLFARQVPPEPWAEGDNIPWNEPGFSARMLAEHLSQAHDAASRRAGTIDRQVAWIHGAVLGARTTRVLDLGCGPGLYASRLARLGHRCVGIDYSPASIAYAREQAATEGLDCTYREADLRQADYGSGFGLALLLYGELNVFPPEQAARILAGAFAALDDGGTLLLEPHTVEGVRSMGKRAQTWSAAASGLFCPRPHLVLREHFWDATRRVATIRSYVVEAADGTVTRYAQSLQAYTLDEYRRLLATAGFRDVEAYRSLEGDVDAGQPDLLALVARR